MKPKIFLRVLAAAAAIAAAWFTAQDLGARASHIAAETSGRKVLYYQSSMHPWIKSDRPGKCPICGMNLVPVYDNGETTHTSLGLQLDSNSVSVANVQSTTVQRQQLVRSLMVAGDISTNPRQAAFFEFTAYASDLAWLKVGQTVEATLPSWPGTTYQAKIKWVGRQPGTGDWVGAAGSTIIRADISSPPVETGGISNEPRFNGFYAEGRVLITSPDVLAVPRSAVLQPGAQPVVYLDYGNGYYELRKVKLGRVGDEFVEVLDGLQEGDRVVTSGNLLIDAEAQISQSAEN